MKLNQKIILFAVLPLLLALCAIALTVRHHAISLAQQEREVIQPAYVAAKEAELKNTVALATRSIAHLYESGKRDEATKKEAKTILEKLEYGQDGYFFLYDFQGVMQMHPRLKEWGKDMWDLKDMNGKPVIRDLIHIAREGGGFYDYVWPKYSTGSPDPKPKRAYVIALPDWGWMLGSGVYMDDVDKALSEIDNKVSRNIDDTMIWIAGIAFMSTLAIFLGLMLNIKERTELDDKLSVANAELTALTDDLSSANTKLRAQAHQIIEARDDERERMKTDLHDGVQPMMVGVKMQIETGLSTLPSSEATAQAHITFKSAAALLKDTLCELRKIIDGIYPVDPDIDLSRRIGKVVADMSYSASEIKFNAVGEIPQLTDTAEKILEWFTKEALTNVVKHANARKTIVELEGTGGHVRLTVCDDGVGFDVNEAKGNLSHGLANMRKRLESVDGKLIISSSSSGTRLTATVPFS